MKSIMIIGATSAIAQATARRYALEGANLYLVARDPAKLDVVAADLATRGAGRVATRQLDVLDYDQHALLAGEAGQQLGSLDVVLIAHGTLPDQHACEADFELARRELEVNGLSIISLLTHLANYFEAKGGGALAVVSSVAGDRGRQSNYLYGTAKGMVSLFLQGLRNRLQRSGVQVITIKPGFVDTPMTRAFDKGALWASPERVARDIHKAVEKGRDVVYTPFFWRYIMWIIKLIPEFLFKRLSL